MSTFEEYDVAYADNKNIHYLAAGPVNGPLLIFVHGWPAIALAWKPQLEAFSALGFRAIAPDMPGYGKSTARKVIEDYSQQKDFEKAIAWYEKDIEGINKALWQPGKPVHPPKPTFTSTVRKDGGWFGGIPQPPSPDQIPAPLLEGEVFDEFTKAMKKTGYWPGSAYYMNHERNHEFNSKAPNDGKFDKPALLIHAAFDYVCETKTTRLAEPMRQACSNLTEVTIQAGHWANMEKPAETSAALSRFILEEVPDYWPGFWDSGYAKRQKSVL
ncbi:epoxide hydrolase [Colletotrichum scovillei]|uniref:Epoxide hydrolase n=1 Tax=Colletotrichum scovillei TaxID=1209932 RepID=A0A9P7UG41_9PEZI|nr:epoxide hydrolase [Colletotrichum scovillei]